MTSPTRSPLRHIDGLDAIRAAAALAVVARHTDHTVEKIGPKWGTAIDLAVPVFFVISGYLITRLLIDEHLGTGTVNLRQFYIRRALRIFPVYFLFVAMVDVQSLIGDTKMTAEALWGLHFYATNFMPRADNQNLIGHVWSLCVEEHFYFLWPPVFVVAFRRSRAAATTVASVALAATVLLRTGLFITDDGKVFSDQTYVDFYVTRWTFVAADAILLGVVAALVTHRSAFGERVERYLGSIGAWVVGVVMFTNWAWMSDVVDAPRLARDGGYYLSIAGTTVLLIWMTLNQERLVVRLMEMNPLRTLGLMSYGIYVYHGFFIGTGPYRPLGQTWPPDSQLVGLILTAVAVPVSFYFYERPLNSLRHRWRPMDAVEAREDAPPPRDAQADPAAR